ncbi:hypothetical protein D3C74_461660 [compost metagenome]
MCYGLIDTQGSNDLFIDFFDVMDKISFRAFRERNAGRRFLLRRNIQAVIQVLGNRCKYNFALGHNGITMKLRALDEFLQQIPLLCLSCMV